jgi:putative Ca2+/H+ antiporter (TMEM165/GDT1 family)
MYAGGFWGAFVNSLSMIIVTELGDKTFFIAAVLAMRDDRLMIFGGAIGEDDWSTVFVRSCVSLYVRVSVPVCALYV